MGYDQHLHHRKTIRFPGYQYNRPGAYFITICVQHHRKVFGEIANDEIDLNKAGIMVQESWEKMPSRFPYLSLDEFVVMLNHFHGIAVIGMSMIDGGWIQPNENANPDLKSIVGSFKSITTCAYIRGVTQFGWASFEQRLWQRNYFERIIRTERELAYIRDYIQKNPSRWNLDNENLEKSGEDEFDLWLDNL
jgi:REP-associated tyrosine transposase